MTNQEHWIPAQSLVEKRPAITQTQKSQTVSFKVNHQTKNQKTKPFCGLWSVYVVDYGYGVSILNQKKKKKEDLSSVAVPHKVA